MRLGGLVWVFAAAMPVACGAQQVMVDWGLHREWAVQADRLHPERPAVLVEIPWKAHPTATADVPGKSPACKEPDASPPVLPGSRVMVASQKDGTEIHLAGVALDRGLPGTTIRVKAGLHGAILRAVVRGPAEVELISAKGRP